MKNTSTPHKTYIALLRGINVGGHHKVPMVQLRLEMEKLGYTEVTTLLNSGNVIFEADSEDGAEIQDNISSHISTVFGFHIPTKVIKAERIMKLTAENPFVNEELNKSIRFYVTFLNKDNENSVPLPWQSKDGSVRIIYGKEGIVCSVLDLSVSNTPKAMGELEKFYGKQITTRNWNTIIRIGKKLN